MYSFKKDIIFSVFTQVLLMILGLLVNKFLSINLGVIEYGEFNIIKRIATVISFVLLAGMGIAIPKYVAKIKLINDKWNYIISGFILIIIITSILYFVLLPFFNDINMYFFQNKNDIILTYIYAVSITMVSFLYSYFRGLNRILLFNIIQLIVQSIILLGSIYLSLSLYVFIKYSIIVNITVFIIFALIEITINYIHIKNVKVYNLKEHIKELWSFGYSRMIGDLFLFSLTVVPLLIINNYFSSSDVAYFSVAVILNSLIIPIFSYIGMILLPKISEYIADGKNKLVLIVVNKLIIIYILLSVVTIIFIFIFNNTLIKLFFSSSYLEASDIVYWTSLAILPNSLYVLLRNPIDVVSKIPFNTINLIISSTIGFLFMLNSYSLEAISQSYLIMYAILGINSYIIWKYLNRRKKNV